jgi:flagellar hook-associated protein 2
VKLDEAAAIPGEEPETQKPMAQVEGFSSIQSGSIGVNGAAITIDVNTDSMTDILDRITASGAEVTASFNSTSQRVLLNSDDPDNPLIIDSGSTNFFSALGISDGTYNAKNDLIEVQGQVVSEADVYSHLVESVLAEYDDSRDQTLSATQVDAADAGMLGTLVNIIADSMNALFDDSALRPSPSAMLEGVRNDIRSAVTATFDAEGPRFDTDFGIHFDFENPNTGVISFSQADQRQLEAALTSPEGRTAVHNMFFGSESNGLLDRLHGILTTAESSLEKEVGSTGIFVNTSV